MPTLPADTEVPVPETEPEVISVIGPWADGEMIPDTYTCDAANTSPALTWGVAPEDTAEVAITVTDDQAPDFVHWAITGLEPAATAIAENAAPEGSVESLNGAGVLGYTGPCPPAGETHTYRYTVHFLNTRLEIASGTTGAEMLAAIDAATTTSVELVGLFARTTADTVAGDSTPTSG